MRRVIVIMNVPDDVAEGLSEGIEAKAGHADCSRKYIFNVDSENRMETLCRCVAAFKADKVFSIIKNASKGNKKRMADLAVQAATGSIMTDEEREQLRQITKDFIEKIDKL